VRRDLLQALRVLEHESFARQAFVFPALRGHSVDLGQLEARHLEPREALRSSMFRAASACSASEYSFHAASTAARSAAASMKASSR